MLAYCEALKEWTRERVPLNWAMTQRNPARVYLAYFEKDGAAAHLYKAERHTLEARKVVEAGATHFLELGDELLASIQSLRP